MLAIDAPGIAFKEQSQLRKKESLLNISSLCLNLALEGSLVRHLLLCLFTLLVKGLVCRRSQTCCSSLLADQMPQKVWSLGLVLNAVTVQASCKHL